MDYLLEVLGLWEKINNPNFKEVEFDSFWQEAGSNAFVLSPNKWIENTAAIGIISKPGKTGGTLRTASRDDKSRKPQLNSNKTPVSLKKNSLNPLSI